MFEQRGHKVTAVENDEECLKLLEKDKPDLIVLDVMMPGLNGWEVCKKIKGSKENASIPVVLLTVRTSEDSVKKSYEYAHCNAHINKPFEMMELLDTIYTIIKKVMNKIRTHGGLSAFASRKRVPRIKPRESINFKCSLILLE